MKTSEETLTPAPTLSSINRYPCTCTCIYIKFYECFLSLEAVCVFVCMHVDVCELDVWGQFSRLGIQVSLAIICLFVRDMVGWVTLPFFSFLFLTLVCYAHVFPCTHYTNER